jgi:arylsulfatase A-like enzyme
MRGFKEGVFEGGIRNALVVRGPGVRPGATSYALSSLMDVTPTIAELAGVTPPVAAKGQLPWTGISLANVVKGGEPSLQQEERMLFSMSAECVEEDFVPVLGPDG